MRAKLLKLIEKNSRIDVPVLAEKLDVSEETIVNEMAAMESEGIICGYHTVINWDKTNIDHVDAFIGVSAKPERGTGYDKIAERIGKFPEVSSLYLTSGTSEFLLSINARTMREVADFVGEKLAPIDGVAATVTMFVLKKYKVNGVMLDMKAEVEDDRQLISA